MPCALAVLVVAALPSRPYLPPAGTELCICIFCQSGKTFCLLVSYA